MNIFKSSFFITFIAVCCFLLGSETINAQDKMAIVNGYSVNYLDFGQRGKKMGVYEQIGDKKWREVGTSKFNFTETHRDEWSVYLIDKSRNVNIQLDLHRKEVIYSAGNTKKTPIYAIMKTSSKVNGWLVKELIYGNNAGAKLGYFMQKEGKSWQEVSVKDGKHNFVETHRDQWSVYLIDKPRNVSIQLDLHTKKVMYAHGNQRKTPLYTIVETSSKMNSLKMLQATKPVQPTSTVVNGYSVNYLNFGQQGRKLGVYEQIGEKKWREVGNTSARGRGNASSFNFVETHRDEWSVYLIDKSRNVNIQLDLHRKEVIYSDSKKKRTPIYTVMKTSSKMNGWLAKEVTYNRGGVKGGTFVQQSGKNWQEISVKDGKHNFVETHRDQWSVYLIDKPRNVSIQLDLHTKKVMYAIGNQRKSPLYDIAGAE